MRILLLDIETSPNTAHVWGLFQQTVSLNQLMESSYTMCWAAKWYKKRGVMFSGLAEAPEKEMIETIWHLLDEADAVVHYNGTRFDMPTLNKEFILHGLPPPSPYKQIDLLSVVRRKFRFPSRKLDYVANALGLGKKTAHEGHMLWVKCMAGDEKAWRKMKRYNIRDVTLLEKVYDRLLPWIEQHPNHALYAPTSKPTCTNCGSTHLQSRGTTVTRTMVYQRYQCQQCSTWLRARKHSTPSTEHILTQDK